MKKAMAVLQVVFYSTLVILLGIYTIGSLVQAGWQSWHIGFVALVVLACCLVKMAVKEAKQVFNS